MFYRAKLGIFSILLQIRLEKVGSSRGTSWGKLVSTSSLKPFDSNCPIVSNYGPANGNAQKKGRLGGLNQGGPEG